MLAVTNKWVSGDEVKYVWKCWRAQLAKDEEVSDDEVIELLVDFFRFREAPFDMMMHFYKYGGAELAAELLLRDRLLGGILASAGDAGDGEDHLICVPGRKGTPTVDQFNLCLDDARRTRVLQVN